MTEDDPQYTKDSGYIALGDGWSVQRDRFGSAYHYNKWGVWRTARTNGMTYTAHAKANLPDALAAVAEAGRLRRLKTEET